MLNKKYKLLELKTKALVDSLFIWNYKTKHKWRWIEFADFREYTHWDPVKTIDFVKSEKAWKTLIKLYEEERELSVYFLIDIKDSFLQKFWNKTKKDSLLEIYYLLWLTAIQSWDKLWALINYDRNELYFGKKWKQNFINILNNIEKNYWKIKSENFLEKIKSIFFKKNKIQDNKKSILSYFNSLKIKNSLVFYLTDKMDFNPKELKVTCKKNDFVLCNIFNSFENNLNWEWIIWINDLNLKIDLQNNNKVEEYRKLRFEKINNLKQKILKYSWRYVLIDEKTNIYKEFYKIFKI